MSQIHAKKALITGGASGIGKGMGLQLLKKGLHTLVIWDINENLMQSTAQEFKEAGYRVSIYKVDVMNTKEVIKTAEKVKQEVGKIDILINNAGIIVGKLFMDHSHDDIDKTMSINSSALMHITKEFLGQMMQTREGHIVNIASAAGMVSNPKMSVYVASKFSVVGWSESLRLEMEQTRSQIKITTVTPFYISTGMFEGVKSSIIPIVQPHVAVRKIIYGIEHDKLYVRMPGIVYWIYFVKGLLPVRWFETMVGKWLGMHKSMDEFKGRN